MHDFNHFGYVLASKELIDNKMPILYMYKEKPDNNQDSGWRFFSGNETEEFLNDVNNIVMCDIKTIVDIDPSIVGLLFWPYDMSFTRNSSTDFFQLVSDNDINNEIQSVRIHAKKVEDNIIYDRSFVCDNICYYMKSCNVGLVHDAFCILQIDHQPMSDEYYDAYKIMKNTNDGSGDLVVRTCNCDDALGYWSTGPYRSVDLFYQKINPPSCDSLINRCRIEVSMFNMRHDKFTTMNLIDLKHGVIHTDKGDITKYSCHAGQAFNVTDCVYSEIEMHGNRCVVSLSRYHPWNCKQAGKYVKITPQYEGKSTSDHYSDFLIEKEWKDEQNIRLLKTLIPGFEFDSYNEMSKTKTYDWGTINVMPLEDMRERFGGCILIKFNGDIDDWR